MEGAILHYEYIISSYFKNRFNFNAQLLRLLFFHHCCQRLFKKLISQPLHCSVIKYSLAFEHTTDVTQMHLNR